MIKEAYFLKLENFKLAEATISEDIQKTSSIIEKINIKYLGTLEQPLVKMLMKLRFTEIFEI